MSEPEISTSSLYGAVLREAEHDALQELPPDQYQSVSEFLGRLRREEYDGIERAIRDSLIRLAAGSTRLLLKIRLDKAASENTAGRENLLDEEKFILDARDELEERREMILSGVLNGRSRLLESIAVSHKTKHTVVRFLQEMDRIVGSDLKQYGPFRPEDIATIPYENAQALMAKKIAVRVRWED